MDALSPIALALGGFLQMAGLVLSPLLILPLLILFLRDRLAGPSLFVSDRIDAVSRALLKIAGWLGLFMAAAMLANVIMRYVYGIGFGWARELWIYAFAGCFMLASAGALQTSAHVRVDILFAGMDLKRKAMVDLAGTLLFLFPLMILILHAYAPQLSYSWGSANGRLELSRETDGLPFSFLFKTLVPVFAVSMILQGWSNAVRSACIIAGLTDTPAPALADNAEPHA
ncbi:MAG: DctQ-like TRAP transporter subunit [Hirschia sp.]|nr:DctQ-like TRAP transporter subunit [Hirschia sp.]MBF17112.1 DctQ-like TRAP transporter subunit [Hirschia sp.]